MVLIWKNTLIPERSSCFDLWVLLYSRKSCYNPTIKKNHCDIDDLQYNEAKLNISNIQTVVFKHHFFFFFPMQKSVGKGPFFFNKYIPMKTTISLITHCFREEGNICLLLATELLMYILDFYLFYLCSGKTFFSL